MSAPNNKRVSGSSVSHDAGSSSRRRIRKPPLRTNTGPAFVAPRKVVQGVGRHSAHHYDPVTGRKLYASPR